jgi:hypothetical protein
MSGELRRVLRVRGRAEPAVSLCVYQAIDADAIRRHSHRVGMPADEINEVADTILVRPDPEPATAAA